ncbi:MAG TPA: hypothetical protein VIW94_01405 [Acidimicrobiia bacterium]
MPIRIFACIFLAAYAACAISPDAKGQFPIIGSDPDRLVETMEWVVAEPTTPPYSFEEPFVMASSTDTNVQIALKGGGCPPTVQAAVSGNPEEVTVVLNLGGAIQPPGVDCPEILSTHILGIEFRQPIDLEGLSVTSVRASGP